MEEKTMISYEGLRELEEELHDRKVNRRREIADAIKVAREMGDLSENAEYDAAKDEQRDNEARIGHRGDPRRRSRLQDPFRQTKP